jgi:hypothetical protein
MQNNYLKNLDKKKLWNFEWLEMGHISIHPYHNEFLVNFNFFLINFMFKSCLIWLILVRIFKFINHHANFNLINDMIIDYHFNIVI